MENISSKLNQLKATLEGGLYTDQIMKALYATDASVYRELPLAVAYPKTVADIKKLIEFARRNKTSLIPRTAGTSLAGQCVGAGIVVDVSKYMNKILEVNREAKWVRVQPGVVRDELNQYLKPFGLFFGPNTSTANRAMIGGMVGNNSCGSYSIVYGTTRNHLLEVETILSNGSEATFKAVSNDEFEAKRKEDTLEGKVYKQIFDELGSVENQQEIRREFPKPEIHRRNTGYAVDVLLESAPFTKDTSAFNFCNLIAGSEGTLAFITEIKLNLVPTPPKEQLLVCAHFTSINEALRAVLNTKKYHPRAVELMDKIVMDCTKTNIEQQKNRFFIDGDPEAVLIIEIGGEDKKEIEKQADKLIADFKQNGLGYHYPKVYPPHIEKVWDLRKAGLGLLSNIPGDAKPVAVIEDTAVTVEELPDYIEEFTELMNGFGQKAVYYAHAGAGELHLRPILNLKDEKDVKLFRQIGKSSAELVKKYKGSLSGEHGDGRVRAEFIPLVIGQKNYELLKRIKTTWDPENIFNPGKIVSAPPMDTSLRYKVGDVSKEQQTTLDFSDNGGVLRAAEKCNGSGDCRKLALSGGTMCPSYMATRNEKDTTRARANVLREFLSNSKKKNPFDHHEIYEVMDLCLSCKGCKSECPSNVDMATLKAEFLSQYYRVNGIPFSAKAIANITKANKLGALFPSLTNMVMKNGFTGNIIKNIVGISPKRSLPPLSPTTLRKWFNAYQQAQDSIAFHSKVFFFCDEFTNYNDVHIGIAAIKLLNKLGYEVLMPGHRESGRTYISKGLLKDAKVIAIKNVTFFKDLVSENIPLIGIEPSAILTFRDEYPNLVGNNLKMAAKKLAGNTFLLEEFLSSETDRGKINSEQFTSLAKKIKIHGHCHQKVISSMEYPVKILSLPENYQVELIPSGCCGMAGSFGYEKDHYEVSMQIGELVLFPAIRKRDEETVVAASGTSCRHQIFDGTKVKAFHPVEILLEALA